MGKKTKRGSILVEASIFLPVFLLAFLTLGCLIRAIEAEASLKHILTDQARRLAAESYLHRSDQITKPGTFSLTEFTAEPYVVKQVLVNRLRSVPKTGGWTPENLQVVELSYLYEEGMRADLIRIRAADRLEVPLPLAFVKEMGIEACVTFRSFTGIPSEGPPFPFTKMEETERSDLVYVFPRAGERYHKETCSVINVSPRQTTLTGTLRKKYNSCGNCKPSSLPNGSQVYCFLSAGSAYHRGSCSSVDRYVLPVEKEEAQLKGYTACKKCGG